MANTHSSLQHVALFFSGAMFWGAASHAYQAIQNTETVTFGIKVEADENWLGVAFHLVVAVLLFWYYKRK